MIMLLCALDVVNDTAYALWFASGHVLRGAASPDSIALDALMVWAGERRRAGFETYP